MRLPTRNAAQKKEKKKKDAVGDSNSVSEPGCIPAKTRSRTQPMTMTPHRHDWTIHTLESVPPRAPLAPIHRVGTPVRRSVLLELILFCKSLCGPCAVVMPAGLGPHCQYMMQYVKVMLFLACKLDAASGCTLLRIPFLVS